VLQCIGACLGNGLKHDVKSSGRFKYPLYYLDGMEVLIISQSALKSTYVRRHSSNNVLLDLFEKNDSKSHSKCVILYQGYKKLEKCELCELSIVKNVVLPVKSIALNISDDIIYAEEERIDTPHFVLKESVESSASVCNLYEEIADAYNKAMQV
jgi:hypothetical protein